MDTNITSNGAESSQSGADDNFMSAFELPNEQSSPNQTQGDITTPEGVTNFEGNTGQPKDPDAVIRNLQSKYDSTAHEYNKYKAQAETWEKHSRLLNEILEDEQVRRAFIAEIAPDLVKTEDIDDFVKNKLTQEFGEDFRFDPEEARLGYGKHFRYQLKAQKLYQEAMEGNSGKLLTVKEIREQQKIKAEQEELQRIEQVTKLKTEFGVDDQTIDTFFKWGAKLQPEQLFKMFMFAQRQSQKNVPELGNQKGGFTPKSSRQDFLDSL